MPTLAIIYLFLFFAQGLVFYPSCCIVDLVDASYGGLLQSLGKILPFVSKSR